MKRGLRQFSRKYWLMVTVLQIKQMVSQAYFGDAVMTETDYSRGRKLFIAEGCCANGVVTLTTGAFLSGYAGYLGADDSLNGIIGSIPVLLCTLQMFSSVVLENLRQKKFLIACFALIHRLLLSSVFFVPLVVEDNAGRLAAVVAIYVVAHFFGAFIGTGTGSWLLSLVPENIRGTYLGRKDAFAFAFTTVLSLLCGRILDWMRGAHQDLLGYYIIGLIVLSTAFTDFWCLSSIREPVQETHRRSLKAAVIDPLLDREYRKVLGLYMFWNLALQVAGPFFSVYMVTGLSLDYTYITFLGLIASSVRVVAACFWGRLADATSWLHAARCSMLLLGLVHTSWLFMTPATCLILQPILQALSGAAWGGIAIAVFSLQYQYAPADKRVTYVSANSSYAGLCGFFATLLGASLLKILPEFSVGEFKVSGMQMIFALSGVLIMLCVRYMRRLK